MKHYYYATKQFQRYAVLALQLGAPITSTQQTMCHAAALMLTLLVIHNVTATSGSLFSVIDWMCESVFDCSIVQSYVCFYELSGCGFTPINFSGMFESSKGLTEAKKNWARFVE